MSSPFMKDPWDSHYCSGYLKLCWKVCGEMGFYSYESAFCRESFELDLFVIPIRGASVICFLSTKKVTFCCYRYRVTSWLYPSPVTGIIIQNSGSSYFPSISDPEQLEETCSTDEHSFPFRISMFR